MRGELYPNGLTHRINAEPPQILVEVLKDRRQDKRLDPGCIGPFNQTIPRDVARGVIVTDDIETAQCLWKQDGGEVCS